MPNTNTVRNHVKKRAVLSLLLFCFVLILLYLLMLLFAVLLIAPGVSICGSLALLLWPQCRIKYSSRSCSEQKVQPQF